MRAAKIMHVEPWVLASRQDKDYWIGWALTMEAAEAEGERMARDLEG